MVAIECWLHDKISADYQRTRNKSDFRSFFPHQSKMKPEPLPAKAQALFTEQKVLHGPFAGLKYPELRSAGSALYPKLLGSYESEIQPWIREICNGDYSEIVDVGCAEDYYAVGLARAIPGAKVYAYDVSPKAQQLCAACASANHVSERVTVRGRFEVNDLQDIRE